jgi:hypothetical protein
MATLWSGRCASRGLALLGAGLTLILVALGIGMVLALSGSGAPTWVGWFVAAVGILVGAHAWLVSSLVVRLTEETFTVAFGPFGWPRRVIPLTAVADASAIVVEPMEWGGYGYRWIPWARTSSVVLRRGPGIALALRDGRRFAVTVTGAVDGAKLTSAALIGAGRV